MTLELATQSAVSRKLATSFAGALAIFVGGMVLVGWALDIAALKSMLPGLVTVKANAALAFVLTGIALFSSRPPSPSALSPQPSALSPQPSAFVARFAQLCALLAGVIGLLTLSEYAFGWNPGFDQWLFPEPAGAVATSHPGRMAPDTAVCFVLLAAGLGIVRRSRKTMGTFVASAILGSLVTTLALASILSYFSPALRTQGWWGLTMMPAPTATLFAALGAALALIAWQESMSEPASPAKLVEGAGPRAGFAFLLVFFLLAAGIIATGTFYYRNYERHYRAEVEQQLSAIAELKVSQLVQWRKERLEDGSVFFQNSAFSALMRRFLEKPEDADAQRQLQLWIAKYQQHHDYDRVRLLDARGVTRLSSPAGVPAISTSVARDVSDVLRSRQMMFQDFYRDDYDKKIYLGILVPILDEQDASRPLGVLALRVDPESYLYPSIKRWPTPSLTGETLLVRRDGNDVLFLHELRFQRNTALTLRVPLDRTTMPAVQAALGREGVMEGIDYRGVPAVAALRTIPDSPWALVARMDAAEVQVPLRGQLWQVVVLIGVLLLGAGACVGLVWRQQGVRFYRKEAAAVETIRETKDYLENLIDHANAPIIVWDTQFKITRFNHAFETLTGRPAGDVIGKSLEILFPPSLVESLMALIQRPLEGEHWETVEIPIFHLDGSVRTVLWNSAAIFAADGKIPVAAIAQGQDITARKEAEEALHTLNAGLEQRVQDRTAQLEAANKELEAFSYSVSHDLRAPLRAIDGFGRILLEDYEGRLDPEGRRVLGVISSETRRMGQLIDDLLGFSRLGRQKLEPSEIDMAAMAQSVFEEQATQAPKRVLQLEVKSLPPAHGDHAMIRVVLGNLISNAIKFTAPRNPAVIEIGSRQQDGQAVYYVKDNGVGFDMTYAHKLFGVFQRLHSAEEFEGTGVGLALIQRVIHRHGGRVWAEGRVNDGAIFSFSLPDMKGTP